MDRTRILVAIAGLAVISALVGLGLWLSRGERIVLQGRIQKVRVQAADENTTAVILDFRVTNPSDHTFVLGSSEVEVETKDGKILKGRTVADVDAERFLAAYPILGPRFNKGLLKNEKVGSKQSGDYMIAASIDAPESAITARKALRLTLVDADGQVSVIE